MPAARPRPSIRATLTAIDRHQELTLAAGEVADQTWTAAASLAHAAVPPGTPRGRVRPRRIMEVMPWTAITNGQ